MGASSSHPILLALNELLRSKNLKIKRSTLERFLEECDTIAPWFAASSNLTVPSWEKLGRDLDFAAKEGRDIHLFRITEASRVCNGV